MHYMHYMHYKDYIHHDFYVYSPVLLTQYLGHCWHTPCTELYILRISAWLLRKPPLPCHRGGEPSGWGRGGVWGSLLIYISYIYIDGRFNFPIIVPHFYHMSSVQNPVSSIQKTGWLIRFPLMDCDMPH